MHQLVLEPRQEFPVGTKEGHLEVAAVVEERTHTAGVGWRWRFAAEIGPVRVRTRRRAPALLTCELDTVRRALEDPARRGCVDLVLRVPDRRAVALLRGESTPRFRRAEAAAERTRALLGRFRSVRFEETFSPDLELAHSVGEALDAGLHAAAQREEHRSWVMERIVDRAKGVVLERKESGWVANGRYRVQLDPMRCECPAWTKRWAGLPIGARRAERLPCKHLVALAMHEGITVPSDLAQMGRRAPP